MVDSPSRFSLFPTPSKELVVGKEERKNLDGRFGAQRFVNGIQDGFAVLLRT